MGGSPCRIIDGLLDVVGIRKGAALFEVGPSDGAIGVRKTGREEGSVGSDGSEDVISGIERSWPWSSPF